MNRTIIALLLAFCLINSYAESIKHCVNWPFWFKSTCQRLYQVWEQGNTDLYISGYAWHNRYTYSSKKIKTYNEQAWGSGLGKGFYDEKGDWHGLSAIIFLDSHKNIEPVVGYTFLKMAHFSTNTHAGIGYCLFVTARPDLFNNIPFPGLLPWASFSYRHLALSATYIPGAKGAGNVLFLIGKWTFNKL
jgi:palmitoyl transferase